MEDVCSNGGSLREKERQFIPEIWANQLGHGAPAPIAHVEAVTTSGGGSGPRLSDDNAARGNKVVRRVGQGTDFSDERTKFVHAPLDGCLLSSGSLVHFNPAWTRLLDV
jgi:hypothetical protein